MDLVISLGRSIVLNCDFVHGFRFKTQGKQFRFESGGLTFKVTKIDKITVLGTYSPTLNSTGQNWAQGIGSITIPKVDLPTGLGEVDIYIQPKITLDGFETVFPFVKTRTVRGGY